MNLVSIMLSEMSQTEKDKNHMISLMWNIKQKATNNMNKRKTKLIDADNRMVVTRGTGGRGKIKRVKEVKCMVTEGDQTSGGEHTTEYTYIIL